MTQSAEQFLNTAKSAVDDLNDVAATSMAGFEKLVALNLATTKAALADAAEQVQSALTAKTPQDLASLSGLVQPFAEKAVAYGRAVAGIVTETGTSLNKAAEARFADAQAQTLANIDAALKQAPAGSEDAVAAFKKAMAAGQNALETAQASAKQALAAAEKNLVAATNVAVKSTKSTAKSK
jgi:phasin family protein